MKNNGTRWRSSFLIGVLAFTSALAIIGSVYTDETRLRPGATVPGPVPHPKQVIVLAQAPAIPHSTAPVYRHSVIPGGVRKTSELTSALARDRFASVHYVDFDIANAYMLHVKAPRLVHVSYRMGDEIYWTKKKVQLSAGETLLTDGKSFVRTRCGNRIADTPQPKVSDREPPPEELDRLIAPPHAPPGAPLDRAGETPNNVAQIMAPFGGFPDSPGNVGVPNEKPIPGVLPPSLPNVPTPPINVVPEEPATDVPEPASFALFMLALIGLIFVRRQRRKRFERK